MTTFRKALVISGLAFFALIGLVMLLLFAVSWVWIVSIAAPRDWKGLLIGTTFVAVTATFWVCTLAVLIRTVIHHWRPQSAPGYRPWLLSGATVSLACLSAVAFRNLVFQHLNEIAILSMAMMLCLIGFGCLCQLAHHLVGVFERR